MSKRSILKIADCDGDQIGGHLDRVRKLIRRVRGVPEHLRRLVGTHVHFELLLRNHSRVVSNPNGRRVLHRSNGSAGDVFTLGEKVRQLLAGGLRRLEPADCRRLVVPVLS